LKPSFLFLAVSPSPPVAKDDMEINNRNKLKAATVRDFISLEVIPIPKFGAKIRGQG
jgi:hypothetical protein